MRSFHTLFTVVILKRNPLLCYLKHNVASLNIPNSFHNSVLNLGFVEGDKRQAKFLVILKKLINNAYKTGTQLRSSTVTKL